VRRFISGRRSQDNNDDIAEEDEALAGQESGTIRPSAARGGSNWGARGISVSADSTLDHHHHPHTDIDASEIADPAAFEDETDDDDDGDDPIKNHKNNAQHPAKQLKASGTNHTTTSATATTSMPDNTANEWAAEGSAGKGLDRD
jgi:hypothetical protein